MRKVLRAISLPQAIDLAKAAQNAKWLKEVSLPTMDAKDGAWAWMQPQTEVVGIYAYRATNHRMTANVLIEGRHFYRYGSTRYNRFIEKLQQAA